MARTLLIGTHKFTWREWLKREQRQRDLLVLDPSDAANGALARVGIARGGKLADYRFVGSLDATRNPLAVVQAAVELSPLLGPDAIIIAPNYRGQPVARQLLQTLAQLLRPDEILVPDGANIPMEGWPVGPIVEDVEQAFPEMVQAAQRRARWLEMIEHSSDHVLPFDRITISGTRLGSGEPLSPQQLSAAGIEGLLWAEKTGTNLLLVSKRDMGDRQIGMALNLAHASKAVVVDPMDYSGRVCSFARQDGEDFGMGMIEEINFVHGEVRALVMSVPPAPVRILKIGTLMIDSTGRELGDDRPWAI